MQTRQDRPRPDTVPERVDRAHKPARQTRQREKGTKYQNLCSNHTPKVKRGVQTISRPCHAPKNTQKESKEHQKYLRGPRWTRRCPKKTPRGFQKLPKASQWAPKGTKRNPKGSQRPPKGSRGGPKGPQRGPKGLQGGPKGLPKMSQNRGPGQNVSIGGPKGQKSRPREWKSE